MKKKKEMNKKWMKECFNRERMVEIKGDEKENCKEHVVETLGRRAENWQRGEGGEGGSKKISRLEIIFEGFEKLNWWKTIPIRGRIFLSLMTDTCH